MAPPDLGPLPPPDFAGRKLPVERMPVGATLIRIHRSALDPLFFGTSGGNRFDDPRKNYGVCYLATTLEGAFAETCLRTLGARFIALSFLAERSFTTMEVVTPLQMIAIHGPGLARMGATSAVSGGPHENAQQWSRAIHDHSSEPHGISYRSNHDNGEFCVALFERAAEHLKPTSTSPLMADRARLAALLARYKVGIG